MVIILHQHLVTMEKFVAERKQVRRSRPRGAEAMPPLGRRALLSCIFSAIINDAASRPLIRRPRCHFRPSSTL
jgi:hypothetical protein